MKRSRQVARALCIAALAAVAPGCVGLVGVVRGTGPYRIDAPLLSTPRGALPPTAEHLRRALGEPESVVRAGDDTERWRYRDGWRLHGVALLLGVVPVPLLLPTGFNHATVTLEQGRAVRVEGRANATWARVGCLWSTGLPFGDGRGCVAEGYAAPQPELRRDGSALWRPAVPGPRPHDGPEHGGKP